MVAMDLKDKVSATDLTHALDARYYTDPGLFEREQTELFAKVWHYAGHVSQLARAGDYFTFRWLDQSFFSVRGTDSVIRTFYNVCQHRAHEMVTGSGNLKRVITCPYHAWAYGLDGRLRKAPNDEKVPGFDRESICLTEVKTEVFCGFIFVNLDPDARPMAEWYPNVAEELQAYVPHIHELVPLRDVAVEEACNWKISVENYSECYHCPKVHKTFANGVIDPDSYNIMPQGHCLRHTTVSANLEAMTYEIDAEANEHATDYSSWFLWPLFSFQVYPGNILNTYVWRPLSVDRVEVTRGWYSIGGEPSEIIERLADQDRDTTLAEDISLVESVQRGLSSRGYRPGPLVIDPDFGVNSEHSIKALHDWLLEALQE